MIAFCRTWPEDRRAYNQANGRRPWLVVVRTHRGNVANRVNAEDICGVNQMPLSGIWTAALMAAVPAMQGGVLDA
jgi:hypothetical protein